MCKGISLFFFIICVSVYDVTLHGKGEHNRMNGSLPSDDDTFQTDEVTANEEKRIRYQKRNFRNEYVNKRILADGC